MWFSTEMRRGRAVSAGPLLSDAGCRSSGDNRRFGFRIPAHCTRLFGSRLPTLSGEPTPLGQGRDIPCTMHHADNHQRVCQRPIVNRLGPMKRHPQPERKMVARRPAEGEKSHWLERLLDRRDKSGRARIRMPGVARVAQISARSSSAASLRRSGSGRLIVASPVRRCGRRRNP